MIETAIKLRDMIGDLGSGHFVYFSMDMTKLGTDLEQIKPELKQVRADDRHFSYQNDFIASEVEKEGLDLNNDQISRI